MNKTRRQVLDWIVQGVWEEKARELFERGILGNYAQMLGVSGRGTLQQLTYSIRRHVAE